MSKNNTKINVIITTFSFILLLLFAVITLNGIFKSAVVNGESMLPTYQSGDVLIAMKDINYAVNDVIIYNVLEPNCDKCQIAHRIISGDSNQGWQTKGDHNPNVDPWLITQDQIVGKIIMVIPHNDITYLLTSKWLWITAIIVILAIYGVLLFRNYRKHKQHAPTANESPHTSLND